MNINILKKDIVNSIIDKYYLKKISYIYKKNYFKKLFKSLIYSLLN